MLVATCSGLPVRTLVCHCLACQRRSGSAFSTQLVFPSESVLIDGPSKEWVRIADSGRSVSYRFCVECGSDIAYRIETEPTLLSIPMGAFQQMRLTRPDVSFDERRMQEWVAVEADEQHD